MSERTDSGSAVPEFVLVLMVFLPLVLGIFQLGLVLHVRNTLIAAASDGARAGAPLGATPRDAVDSTRRIIGEALAESYASDVTASDEEADGVRVVAVRVHTTVPALGLFGHGVELTVQGHAVRQDEP